MRQQAAPHAPKSRFAPARKGAAVHHRVPQLHDSAAKPRSRSATQYRHDDIIDVHIAVPDGRFLR
jgi:hypothetical protein